MTRWIGVAGVLVMFAVSSAQAASTVLFDAAPGTSAATANGWTSALYVNGTRFALVHQCSAVAAVVTCSALMPDITAALTPSGPQSFQIAFVDGVLGEGPKSAPFTRDRPAAPISGRFQ